MIQTSEDGKVMVYIMEPEEELNSLRWIADHNPNTTLFMWHKIRPRKKLTLTEHSLRLNLKGGYGLHFHDFEERDYL